MDNNALFKLTNGLYVLGAVDNGNPVGSLIDAVTQVAHSPNIIIISCGNNSYTKQVVEQTGVFSLSILVAIIKRIYTEHQQKKKSLVIDGAAEAVECAAGETRTPAELDSTQNGKDQKADE